MTSAWPGRKSGKPNNAVSFAFASARDAVAAVKRRCGLYGCGAAPSRRPLGLFGEHSRAFLASQSTQRGRSTVRPVLSFVVGAVSCEHSKLDQWLVSQAGVRE